MSPIVSVIVAVAENGVIGRDGGLPWKLSGDLRYFKAITMGKPIVMGRKTYESIGRPLPGRPNIVVTRNPEFAADGIDVVADMESALDLARSMASASGGDEVMVIGGAQLYEAALPRAARVYLTRVHADIVGDTTFAELDPGGWREVSREERPAGEKDEFPHSFIVLERVTTA